MIEYAIAGMRFVRAGLMWGLLAGAGVANAAETAATPPAKPVPIPQSEELDLRSKAGLDYRIFIFKPQSPPPAAGYPLLYVLDGNAWFEPLASAMRLQARNVKFSGISPAVVVGIAYPGDVPFNTLRRFYDFVPDVPLKEQVPPGVDPPKLGGAEPFLKFIREEVEPAITARVKIDPTQRTLFGHSLGCSFTLHVLFTQPQAFRHYVCSSPSLGFNGAYILESAERFEQRLAKEKVDATLLLAAAEYDETMPPGLDPKIAAQFADQLKRARVVTGARELAEKLAPLSKAGLQSSFMLIPGENHISMVPVLINRMLPIVLRPQDGD